LTVPALIDRRLLKWRRERAVRAGGDLPDFLLRRVSEEIVERLGAVERDFSPVVAVAALPGILAEALRPKGEAAILIEMAESAALLSSGGHLKLIGAEELFPFKPAALGLLVSALTLQFANDLPGTLVQIRRALMPDGLFLAAVLGGQTLFELRQALIDAETELEGGASPRVLPMTDIRDYGGLLQRAGFALPVADADLVTVTYASPLGLLRDLRGMGATNALTARRKMSLRRPTLMRALEIYAERFPAPGGRVKASFEIIYLSGWAPHESQQKPLRPGSAAARLADALGTKEHKLKG
jgi:hypothetical protein